MVNTQPNLKGLRIVVSFVDDFVTQSAFVGQFLLKKLSFDNKVIRLPAKSGQAIEVMVRKIEKALRENRGHSLQRLEITGHSYPARWAGRLNYEELISENSSKKAALVRLKPLWSPSNEGLILRMCSVASGEEGRQFMEELAKTVGAKVTAWTGIYEIRPTGEEWTASPDGVVTKTGDTGRTSYFGPWRDRPLLKKIITTPAFLALMAWRTITGK
ncbi:MAG: DUF4347 domain-containing protein [Gemmataceae bacterium]